MEFAIGFVLGVLSTIVAVRVVFRYALMDVFSGNFDQGGYVDPRDAAISEGKTEASGVNRTPKRARPESRPPPI